MQDIEYELKRFLEVWAEVRHMAASLADEDPKNASAPKVFVDAGDLLQTVSDANPEKSGIVVSFERKADGDIKSGNMATEHFLRLLFDTAGHASPIPAKAVEMLREHNPETLRERIDSAWAYRCM